MPALPPSPRALGPIPDLLCLEPALRVDLGGLKETLVFAFAAGSAIESFDDILGRATLPPSAWDRSYFARDLFLSQLIEKSLPVRALGQSYEPCAPYLLRAIGEPPKSPEILAFRRALLGELAASSELRGDFERVYVEIVRLRALLSTGRISSATLRRLEILRVVHAVFGLLGELLRGRALGPRSPSSLRRGGLRERGLPAPRRAARSRRAPRHRRCPRARRRRRRAPHLPGRLASARTATTPFTRLPLGPLVRAASPPLSGATG